MNNETKWDVFKIAMKYAAKSGWLDYDDMIDRYDAALPDDLPVVPKKIGEYIERQKQGSTLRSALTAATYFNAVDYEEADWIFYNSDIFARALVLGVWRVEETGEIVKLEAEK